MSPLETFFAQVSMELSQEIEEQSDFMTESERMRVNNCFLAWSMAGTVLLSLLNHKSPFTIPRKSPELVQGDLYDEKEYLGSTLHFQASYHAPII